MAVVSAPTTEELLQRVRELEPLIREHAAAAERDRRMPKPVSDAMRDAGFFRMYRPEALGGLGLDPVSAFRVMEALARIDSAAGWNAAISNASEPFGAGLTEEAARIAYGSPDNVFAGSFNPPRTAVPVDGGYRVTGQTPFNSNCYAANWIIGLAVIQEDDGVRLNGEGDPETLITFMPSTDVKIVDNWDTLGMSGTGSHDVLADDVFVPESLTCILGPVTQPNRAYDTPFHKVSTWSAIVCNSVPALGIAQAAIDDLVMLGQKVPAYTQRSLRDRNSVQLKLAKAVATLGAARALLYTTYDEMWQKAIEGQDLTMEDKARCQLAASYAALASAEAVDHVHACVGASGIRNDQKFQRYFRDIHVITQHGFICESRLEAAGQVMLGLDPEWPFFYV